MSSVPRIVTINGEQVVWPGSIALHQYEARARRCSACEHRLPEERNRCALMHDRPPFNRGVASISTHSHMDCPDGRWQNETANQTAIIDALKPIDGNANIIQRVAHGATGLVKAAFGLERCDDATLAHRRATCAACDQMRDGRCNLCGCLLAAKQRLAGERCPAGHW
jgi:hypothetical protein